MMEKELVWKNIKSFSSYDFDGHSLDEVIAKLNGIKRTHSGTHLKFKVTCCRWEGMPGYPELDFIVAGQRLETQEELEARQNIIEARAKKERERELRQLAALKKKYESGD